MPTLYYYFAVIITIAISTTLLFVHTQACGNRIGRRLFVCLFVCCSKQREIFWICVDCTGLPYNKIQYSRECARIDFGVIKFLKWCVKSRHLGLEHASRLFIVIVHRTKCWARFFFCVHNVLWFIKTPYPTSKQMHENNKISSSSIFFIGITARLLRIE